MTLFTFRYGRKFRTGQYETAEMSLEEQFDDADTTILDAHDVMKGLINTLVDSDKEEYARDTAKNPERRH